MAEVRTPEFLGTGRRKTSVARVRLASGSGKIVINNRPLEKVILKCLERNPEKRYPYMSVLVRDLQAALYV